MDFQAYNPRSNTKKVVAVFGALAVVAVIAVIAFSSDNGLPTGSKFFSQSGDIERFTEEEREFMKFITENRRFYFSKEEYNHRLQIFTGELRMVRKHNENPEKSFTLGINEFSDMTAEEFKYNYLNNITPTHEGEVHTFDVSDLPNYVNWLEEGDVTTVKNQGKCGSCWSFSATGAIEGAYSIKYDNLDNFSEQQMVDCCGAKYGSYGCNGGEMNGAFRYVQQKGQFYESQYPYTATDGECQYNDLMADSQPAVFLTGYKIVTAWDSNQLMAAAAITPVAVAIEAGQPVFRSYNGGILNSPACGTNLNHGVLVVGYGNQDGQDYWLVKNSWGPSWGVYGYIMIARTPGIGKGICGIAMQPSYPVVK